jgi:hypothetical protein
LVYLFRSTRGKVEAQGHGYHRETLLTGKLAVRARRVNREALVCDP